jgi:hypothetical protein
MVSRDPPGLVIVVDDPHIPVPDLVRQPRERRDCPVAPAERRTSAAGDER